MKHSIFLILSLFPVAFVSCDYNAGLSSQSGFSPLDPPGSADQHTQTDPYAQAFQAGSFKQTISPMSAFYISFPTAMEQPTKNLPNHTDVKVISTKGSYVKVEVINTGEIGFIPSVMLGEKRSPNEVLVSDGNNGGLTAPTNVPEVDSPSIEPIGIGNSHLPAE